MVEKFAGVHLDEEEIHELKKLALKERKKLKELHKEIVLDYIKKHGDGNPAFTLDQFVESKDMMAVPALFREREDWDVYLYDMMKHDPQQVQKVLWQAQTVVALAKKRLED